MNLVLHSEGVLILLGSTAIHLADVSVLKFQVFSGCQLSFFPRCSARLYIRASAF